MHYYEAPFKYVRNLLKMLCETTYKFIISKER